MIDTCSRLVMDSIAMDQSQSGRQSVIAHEWEAVLRAGVEAQRLVPGSIAVGGTAAALYAHHRVSGDTDHLLADLVPRFDEVRATLEATPAWKTARLLAPKLILGSLGNVPVGFRQMIRTAPIETARLETSTGSLVVPTLEELFGMKAYLAYSRRATRDFVDFAALASCLDEHAALASLLHSDVRYGELQTDSVSLEIAKALSDPQPYDLDSIDLRTYKGIQPPWDNWSHTEAVCKQLGLRFAEVLLQSGPS